MLPPAPGTFSISIGWPSASPAPSATMRATTSEEPPGPKGTTNLSGLLGNVCACAIAAKARPSTSRHDRKRRFICIPSGRRCRESTPFRARTPRRLYLSAKFPRAEPAVRILVIEDEKKVATALREGLEAEHYEVRTAADGEEGFSLASRDSFDLVLLDLMLPRRDGIEVLTALRKRRIPTPVFILTAKDAVEDRVLGLDRGADDYLVKPFTFPE